MTDVGAVGGVQVARGAHTPPRAGGRTALTRAGTSRSSASLTSRSRASQQRRKSSTPRSSQSRITPCIASTTSGLRQSRSHCSESTGMQVPAHHSSTASTPGPPNAASQVVRRLPSPSAQTWKSEHSRNQQCSMDVVAGHEVHQELQAAAVSGGHQACRSPPATRRPGRRPHSRIRSVARVGERGGVDRETAARRPSAPRAGHVRFPRPASMPPQVTDAVAVGVSKRAQVDLVDDHARRLRGRAYQAVRPGSCSLMFSSSDWIRLVAYPIPVVRTPCNAFRPPCHG